MGGGAEKLWSRNGSVTPKNADLLFFEIPEKNFKLEGSMDSMYRRKRAQRAIFFGFYSEISIF